MAKYFTDWIIFNCLRNIANGFEILKNVELFKLIRNISSGFEIFQMASKYFKWIQTILSGFDFF